MVTKPAISKQVCMNRLTINGYMSFGIWHKSRRSLGLRTHRLQKCLPLIDDSLDVVMIEVVALVRSIASPTVQIPRLRFEIITLPLVARFRNAREFVAVADAQSNRIGAVRTIPAAAVPPDPVGIRRPHAVVRLAHQTHTGLDTFVLAIVSLEPIDGRIEAASLERLGVVRWWSGNDQRCEAREKGEGGVFHVLVIDCSAGILKWDVVVVVLSGDL